MNIDMLQAYVEGYQERLFDEKCLAVQQGYWAGYFRSKRPRPLGDVLSKLDQEHQKMVKNKHKKGKNVPKPEVDMDRFLRLEQKRMQYLESNRRK